MMVEAKDVNKTFLRRVPRYPIKAHQRLLLFQASWDQILAFVFRSSRLDGFRATLQIFRLFWPINNLWSTHRYGEDFGMIK